MARIGTVKGWIEIEKPKEFTGLEIQQIRMSFGCTREEFAQILGVALSTYGYWEAGKPPIGPARRLLSLMRSKGEKFLEEDINLI